jgi:hypothetical protein
MRYQPIPLAGRIRIRVAQLRSLGRRTSKGEPMSLAAIGRTLDPPIHRVNFYRKKMSRNVINAIERELDIRIRNRRGK